jgi:hypothetical protein
MTPSFFGGFVPTRRECVTNELCRVVRQRLRGHRLQCLLQTYRLAFVGIGSHCSLRHLSHAGLPPKPLLHTSYIVFGSTIPKAIYCTARCRCAVELCQIESEASVVRSPAFLHRACDLGSVSPCLVKGRGGNCR